MPKAYWITCYREIKNPDKVAAYAKLAVPALAPFGARYLARGTPGATFEAGQKERVVVTEWPSLAGGGRRPRLAGLSGGAQGARRRRGARHPHRRGAGVAGATPLIAARQARTRSPAIQA